MRNAWNLSINIPADFDGIHQVHPSIFHAFLAVFAAVQRFPVVWLSHFWAFLMWVLYTPGFSWFVAFSSQALTNSEVFL